MYFQKRLLENVINDISEHHFKERSSDKENSDGSEEQARTAEAEKNSGILVIDSTCCLADIAYPKDLELCDKARKWNENIFDYLYETQEIFIDSEVKLRTFREVVHSRFLKLNKRRKKLARKIYGKESDFSSTTLIGTLGISRLIT